MQVTPLTSRGHKPELDGLRAVALIFVVLEHSFYPFRGGFIGVDIFFVLSGYLITSLLYREWDDTGRISLTNFYLRRFLRLSPALFSMLAVYLTGLVAYYLLTHKMASAAWTFAESHLWALGAAATYSMNWNIALNLGPSGFLEHTWTLGIEEQFYLLWPPLLIFSAHWFERRGLATLCLLLILACTGWRLVLWLQGVPPQRIYMGLDTRVDALMMGCWLALWPFRQRQLRWLTTRAIIPTIVLLVLLPTLTWDSVAYKLGSGVVALSSAWVIVAVLTGHASPLAKLMRLPPMTYLGRISYGCYLWHYPAFMGLQWLLPLSSWVGWLSAPLALTAAALSYTLVETPIRALARRPPQAPRSLCVRELV